LATGGADRMVKLWDVESGTLIKTLEGHTHHVTAIAWNINLRQLASGSADATVKVWDLDSGQSTRTISGLKSEVTRLVYIGRDDRVGFSSGDGYFRVYRTNNGSRETNAKVPGGYLYALDANRDGTRFIVGGADGVAVVIDKSGKQLSEYKTETD
jgi:WD40 repeat protein